MRKLRVLVLMDKDFVPPDSLKGYQPSEILEWKTEFDVVSTLREIGHHVHPLGVSDDLGEVRQAILEDKPHIVFNLLEEFHGVALFDQHIASYLELMQQPYTGCNPRGLTLGHDKVLCKQILTYHRIPTPRFVVFLRNKVIRPQRKLKYPLLVKSVIEEASLGITRDSIVYTDKQLVDRVLFIHEEVNTDALVEEFIEGREFYVGVMGNQRLQTFPVWELLFKNLPDGIPNIATARVKWDIEYQRELGVTTRAVTDLPAASIRKIVKLCKRIYRALYLSGYARIDLRVNPEGQIYVLEANPNPDLSYGEDFAESASTIDISYEKLLTRIVNLGLRYQPSWRG